MKKIIAIVGPTASGKSDLGIQLAKKYHTDIISVDSRQVYEKMDLGTGKVEGLIDKTRCMKLDIDNKHQKLYPLVSEQVNHWLLNIVDPVKKTFSVAQYQDLAYQVIFKLLHDKKMPILVGGSALYMDAVLEGYNFPKTSINLRKELEKFSTQKLLSELKKIDKTTYKKIDKSNRVRVLRAVESYLVNRKSHLQYKKNKPGFDYIIIGIDWPRKELYQRIDTRVDQRIKLGMIDEIRRLHENGVSYNKLYNFGLEYRYISLYLQGKLTRGEMIQKLKYKIHAFARRQLTWWRRNKKIIWLKPDGNMLKHACDKINKFI